MSQLPNNVEKIDLSEQKQKNDAFIAEWKRSHGVMKQTKLRTKGEEFSAWVLDNGWSLNDIRAWNRVLDALKLEAVFDTWPSTHALVLQTLEVAEHMKVHPVGILCYARLHMKQPVWTLEALVAFRSQVLSEEREDESHSSEDAPTETPPGSPRRIECPPAPRKRQRRSVVDVEPDGDEDDCSTIEEFQPSQKYDDF